MAKNTLLPLSLALLFVAAAPRPGFAQTVAAKSDPAAVSIDRYLLRDGEVVLMRNQRPVPLTRNVVLSNGTKINYKSAIVEFPGGKKTTLHEGDYVRLNGDIVYATPASAAAARGDNSVPADAKFDPYLDKGSTGTRTVVLSSSDQPDLPTLLTRKIQLLEQKIGLMTPNPTNRAALSSLDQQLTELDAQINR